jgi:two-component system heavy metal sensor histidine kinase CusS
VTGGARPVQADRLLVQRAITNLLSNAIRHANEGSTITIELATSGEEATLAVVNEGQTIDPTSLPRIFERFYRVDQSRSRGAGGTGLGLAIVRSIAALHQGHVGVASESGRTTFTLFLPCTRDGAMPALPVVGERARA